MSARDDGPQPTSHESDGMTRRGLLARGGTIAGGAIGTIAVGDRVVPRYSPIGRAAAAPPLAPILIGAYTVAHYMLNNYGGDDIEDEYVSKEAFEYHLGLYNEAQETRIEDGELLTALEREAEYAEDSAREDAIMAMYEAVATGADRSTARADAEAAVAKRFTAPEKSLSVRVNQVISKTIPDGTAERLIYAKDPDNGTTTRFDLEGSADYYTCTKDVISHEFYDGSVSDVQYITATSSGDYPRFAPFGHGESADALEKQMWIDEPDPNDYNVNPDDYDLEHVDGDQLIVDGDEYQSVLNAIQTSYDNVMAEIDALLETHYDGMSSGDLSLEDMLSTDAMLGVVESAESWQEASLYFRSMGIPQAVEPARVSFDVSGIDDFDTQRAEYDGMIAWTLSTDVEGNELPVGSVIDPGNYPGEMYLAIEYEDDSGNMVGDIIHLTTEFVIEGINSGSDYLQFEKRAVVTSDTTPEEATEIFTQHQESEQAAREQTIEVVLDDGDDGGDDSLGLASFFGDGGGGGLLGLGLIAAAGAAIAGIVSRGN